AATRSPVHRDQAMVVTSHELATEVGVNVLKDGGNAVDAAIAVGFALAAVYPTAGNIGGGGFMVIRFPDGSATTIDFREKAPMKAHRNMYLDENGEIIDDLSLTGYLASGVPGTVAGLEMAHRKFGTIKWQRLVKPAIDFAKKGFVVGERFAGELNKLAPVFSKFPSSQKVFMKKNGEPYIKNDVFKQPDLANTLKQISKKGADGFYKGKVAELIAKDMAKNGGLITKEDLADYQAVERKPIRGIYRGHEIISMGPPSSGGIAIVQILNILEKYDLRQLGYHSSKYVHLLAETFKRVYFDRARYLGDLDFVSVPVDSLTSKDYADSLRKTIDMQRAIPAQEISKNQQQLIEGNHTTHYSIVDRNGMMIAVTTTINSGYGSKVVVDGAGFLMNNEMDDFAAKPGKPNTYGLVSYEVNAIVSEKRMLSSMSPTIILKEGKPYMTLGSMGGSRIITAVLQIILNVIDHGMNIQQAVDAPRIHHQWLPDVIRCERFAFPLDVTHNLRQMGHEIQFSNHYSSEAHAILIDPENQVLHGAADSRYTGTADGY
ncbi:gamma-glutamyltransferase, partial [candidate division KSB1 bacterium]|nr:gamma-glutamyltransferase [candidate division KSB1 bacterium]